MSSAWSRPLRALATQTAVITIIGLGLAAPATAAPGDNQSDNRNDKAAAAMADSSEKSTQASTKGSAQQETRASGSKAETKSTTSSTPPAKDPDDSRRNQTGEQPVSGADQNSGGANGSCTDDDATETGSFCGTEREDMVSGNGQGKGEATGKPYQAHRGKADNKNPPGQVGNTRDNGYECDGNQGIAKGNPAHTSCTPPPNGGGGNGGGGGGNGGGNGGGGGGGTVIGGVDTVTPPVVAGVEMLVPPAGVQRTVRPEAPAAALPGAAVLPATGSTPAMTALSAVAFGMLALGAGLLFYRRASA